MDQLVEATVVEYGAPQDRAKGSNNLAANIFLHSKKVLEDFDLVKTVGTSKVVMEPAGVALHVKPDKMPELERETFTA
jgi:aldehyde dehydrogenase (NAD+)